jgi:dephospho-CoA kinase
MDEVWLIVAHETLRIQRVASRDRLDTKAIRQRIRMQMTDEQKARHAYRIIHNSGSKKELYEILEKILRNYETV